ncbi:MAG: HAD family hydrolase [Bulleidia sp.]
MKKVAIVYDFDKTLCTKDMQEYSLIPALGYDDAGSFWKEVSSFTTENKMDPISAYLYVLMYKFRQQDIPLRPEMFESLGKAIVLYPGVETWFSRINAFGKLLGLEVEHYIISSGMHEIIDSTVIADEFRQIYACRYYYGEDGTAQWPARLVNYTTKTQYIFRINKQVLDENDDQTLNRYVAHQQRPIPFERMVYIADGLTDVPCMRLVKEYGGKSIAVYSGSDATARQLMEDGRINFMTKADYSAGSDMEKLMQKILRHMSADAALEDLDGVCL